VFLEVNGDALVGTGVFLEELGGAVGEVAGILGQAGVITGEGEAGVGGEGEGIGEADALQHHGDGMKSLSVFADNAEEEVDFGVGIDGDGLHSGISPQEKC